MMKVKQDDEGEAESLGGLSIRGRSGRLCHDPLGSLHREEAGLEYARDLDGRSGQTDRPITLDVSRAGVAGQLREIQSNRL